MFIHNHTFILDILLLLLLLLLFIILDLGKVEDEIFIRRREQDIQNKQRQKFKRRKIVS